MSVPDDTREKLIDAAGPLFAEKGPEATTVRDITERAGVNVSAVHYHFRGTGPLYREAVRAAAAGCMSRAAFPDWPPGTPPTQKLRDFIETQLRRVAVDCHPAWHSQLIMRELAQPTEACADFAHEFVRPIFGILRGILAEMLPEGVDARKLRLCGMSIVGQILHYRFARPVIRRLFGEEEFGQLTVEALTEHIHEFSIAALRSLAGRHRRKEAP